MSKWPVMYWDGGHPHRVSPRWSGRGLAIEVGPRVYAALLREPKGWWPKVLDDHEQRVGVDDA